MRNIYWLTETCIQVWGSAHLRVPQQSDVVLVVSDLMVGLILIFTIPHVNWFDPTLHLRWLCSGVLRVRLIPILLRFEICRLPTRYPKLRPLLKRRWRCRHFESLSLVVCLRGFSVLLIGMVEAWIHGWGSVRIQSVYIPHWLRIWSLLRN